MIPNTAPIIEKPLTGADRLATAGVSSQRRASRLLWFVVALLLTVSFAFPLYFMASSGFKANPEVLARPIHWWPEDFQGLNQFILGFQAAPLGRYFLNSGLMATID